MLAGAAPALLALFIAKYVPESERWKESVKKEKAKSRSPIAEVFSPSLRRSTIIGILAASVVLIGTWGSVQWLPAWADQLTKGQVHNAKGLAQTLIGVGAMLGCFVGPWIGARMGRRPAYFFLCFASLVVSAYLFRCVDEYGATFLVMAFLAGATTASFFGWLPLYLPELFPTRVRATGQGLCFNVGRIFAAIGAIEMGHLMSYYEGSYARAGAAITLVYLAGMVLIWFGPETRNRQLPE